VLRAVAVKHEGTDALIQALDRHAHYLETSGMIGARRRARLRDRVVEVVHRMVRDRLWPDPDTDAWVESRLPELESGAANPFQVAEELLRRSAGLITRGKR
jgi:LAO/AO transport system kinase